MRCLLLSSLVIIICLAGCKSAYKTLSPGIGDASCLVRLAPAFNSTLYNTQVNVIGKHLSGLLLFKEMPDSSLRVVFSSEMGVKFFDFEFGANGSFKVYQVMSQLNKKTVINTLRSDFELLLMRNLSQRQTFVKSDGLNTWYGFNAGKETHYYITNKNCDTLLRIENAMKRKPKVQIAMMGFNNRIPDSIGITHRNFNFDIGLKYIKR